MVRNEVIECKGCKAAVFLTDVLDGDETGGCVSDDDDIFISQLHRVRRQRNECRKRHVEKSDGDGKAVAS